MKTKVFLIVLCCIAVVWASLGVVPVDDTSISSKLWGTLYRIDGTQVQPGQIHTVQNLWTTLGTFTTATPTTYAVPGSASRTAAAFNSDAETNATITIDPSWNTIRVRCLSTTDDDDSSFDFWLMNGSDHFNRIATIQWITGTQKSSTAGSEFADTLIGSNDNWGKTAATMTTGNNFIAEWWVNVAGSGTFGASAATITTTATLEITGY